MSRIFGRIGRDSLLLTQGQLPTIFRTTVWGLAHHPLYYRGYTHNKAFPNLFGFVGGIYESSFSCQHCHGEGHISECEECDEGGNSCEECEEDGYSVCPECSEGQVECDYCEGEGQIFCKMCDEGESECRECEGSLQIECGDCEGKGEIEGEDGEKETCSNCEGSQNIDCDSCEDGRVECKECLGNWNEDCDDCHEGYIDCGYCEDGYTYCEYCEDGWAECGECGGDWEGGECDGCDGLGTIVSRAAAKNRGTHYVKPVASNRKQRVIKFNKLKKTMGNIDSQEVFGEFNSVVFYPAHLINDRWASLNLSNLKTVTYIIYPAIVGNEGNTEYSVVIVPLFKSNNSTQINRTIELRENQVLEKAAAMLKDTLDFSRMANRYKPYPQYEAAIVVTDIPISEKSHS